MLLKKLKVYVAGPILSSGNPFENIHKGAQFATKILKMGHIPFLPHVNALWSIATPFDEKLAMDWDLEWMKVCDFVVRIPGTSVGSENEQKIAEKCGIPVMSMTEFEQYCNAHDMNLLMTEKIFTPMASRKALKRRR